MSNAKFGAKEVMDVVLYDMETDKPVIQFDSLKTSSISATSEKVYARGGKGNPKLITWEINKEATLTIEDALISPKSMELVSGIARKVGVQTIRMRQTTEYENGENKGKMYPLKADATGKIVGLLCLPLSAFVALPAMLLTAKLVDSNINYLVL